MRSRLAEPGRRPAVLAVCSFLLTCVVAVLGPSAIVLTLGQDSAAAPPWHADTHPTAWFVVPATAAALLLGSAALLTGLLDLARGWVPRAGRWVAGGTVAVLATVALPPGSTGDPLIYAAYGRLASLGSDPYLVTPRALILVGDPVGRSTEGPWQQVTSVYGPLATGEQALASWLGGPSTALTVFWMQLANAVGWIVAGLLLLVIARRSRVARSRVVLLWWVNPLMVWAVLTGGHNDAIAAAFLVAALLLLGRSALLSGVALGAAGTVKLVDVLVGAGLLWAVRRQPRAAAALVGAAVVVAGAAYAPVLPEALAQTSRARGYLSSSSPWQEVKDVVGWFTGTGGNVNTVMADVSWAAVLALVVLIARQSAPSLLSRGSPATGSATAATTTAATTAAPAFPVVVPPPSRVRRLVTTAIGTGGRATGSARVGEAARAAFVVSLAWLLGGYYTLPWYDLTAWIPLCLLAASGLDLVLLIRTTVICLAYVATRSLPPTQRLPPSLASAQLHVEHDISPVVHLLLIAALVVRLTRPDLWSRAAGTVPGLSPLGRPVPSRPRPPATAAPSPVGPTPPTPPRRPPTPPTR